MYSGDTRSMFSGFKSVWMKCRSCITAKFPNTGHKNRDYKKHDEVLIIMPYKLNVSYFKQISIINMISYSHRWRCMMNKEKNYTHATHSNSCLPISRTRSMGNER